MAQEDQRKAREKNVTAPALAPDPGMRSMRIKGLIFTVGGLVILALIVPFFWEIMPALLAAPPMLPDGSNFDASQASARPFMLLLSAVVLFGLLTLSMGIQALAVGRIAARLILFMQLSAGLMLISALWLVILVKFIHPPKQHDASRQAGVTYLVDA